MTLDAFLLRKHTRREIRQYLADKTWKACIVPVAAVEQHLEHLAIEHDWRSATEIGLRVAQRLAPDVIVADALIVGISEHHMRHPGTLTLRPGTFLAALNDVLRSLHLAGFRNVLVLNGHGGNIAPCQSSWDQFQREFQSNLQFLNYWDVLTEQDAIGLLRSGQRMPEDLPGHAQEFETSIALALFPENVRRDAMEEQEDTSPLAATADQGAEFVQRIVTRVAEHLRAMIDGRSVAKVPPFFP